MVKDEKAKITPITKRRKQANYMRIKYILMKVGVGLKRGVIN
jgi:hypothetical protein